MPRKPGPKPGRFAFMVERTWTLIASLADTQWCNAGDTFIAQKLGVAPRTARRYIKKLKDTGRLTRMTASYMVPGGWRKRRLMKTRFEKTDFGLTRFEVLNWSRTAEKGQPVKTHVVQVAAPPKPRRYVPGEEFFNKRNPYFEIKLCDIEGFGDPYHEDMDLRNVIPSQGNIAPKTKCIELLARIKAEMAAVPDPDPELLKLRSRYVLASIARGRAGPPLGTT